MSSRRASVFVLGVLATGAITQGLAACNGDDSTSGTNTSDASADHAIVAVDSGPAQCSGDLPVMVAYDPTQSTEVAPDWSCYDTPDAAFLALDGGDDGGDATADDGGDATAEDASDASSAADADASAPDAADAGSKPDADASAAAQVTFHLADFVSHTSVGGANVDFFYARTAAGAPDFNGTTDTDGKITLVPPAKSKGVLIYRVNAKADPSPAKALETVMQYDNVIPKPPTALEGNSITVGGGNLLLSGVLGSQTVAPGTSVLTGGARDCKGREIKGGVLTLIDGQTGQPVALGKAQGQPRASYFSNGFPTEGCTFTNDDQAIWVAINVTPNMPGNTHPYMLRFSGRKDASQKDPVTLGEVAVELWPDTNTVARPYRLTPP